MIVLFAADAAYFDVRSLM